MISFFRKIRRKLFTQNKLSSYLLYGIGEIVLVVIGILIALGINNWNEDRKDKIRSEHYLERMVDEITNFSKTLADDSLRAEELRVHLESSMNILGSKSFGKAQKDTLDFTLINYNQFVQIPLALSSYEEMKSNGDLGLIYSPELRQQINSYNSFIGTISKIYEQLSDEFARQEFIKQYVTYRTYPKGRSNTVSYHFDEMAGDQVLINTLSGFAVNWETKRGFSNALYGFSQGLKFSILKELDNY